MLLNPIKIHIYQNTQMFTHTLGILKCLIDQSYQFKLVNTHHLGKYLTIKNTAYQKENFRIRIEEYITEVTFSNLPLKNSLITK